MRRSRARAARRHGSARPSSRPTRACYDLGWAHSVECWHGDRLAGGIYGVAIGAWFGGESMFAAERDASKVALAALVARLAGRGYVLFDAQVMNPHLASLGAIGHPAGRLPRQAP